MKRIAIIFFTILYLIPAVGLSLDLHKCGKKIKVVSINASHHGKCPCGANMPMGCCKDIHFALKFVDSQKESKSKISLRLIDFKLNYLPVCLKIGEIVSHIDVFDFSNYHAPPFKNKQPVYLANNIFRI